MADADPASPSWDPNGMQSGSSQVDLAEPGASSGPGTWSASRCRPLVRPIAYFALSRLVVLAATLAAKLAAPRLNPFRALTSGWDGYWYLMIAQHGYPHRIVNENHGSRWAFFPAYPAFIRATVDVTGLSYAQSAFLLSIVLGLTAVVAVWLAVREAFGPVVANRSVLLFVFFPASFVLSMAYTEALFITAVGLCLFAISRRWWISASMFAVLGSLTRSFGFVLIACVAVAAIPVVLRDRKIRPLIAMALSPLGLVAWLAYSKRVTGTPLAFLKAEKFWGGSHFVWFTTPIRALLTVLTEPRAWGQGQVLLCAVAAVFAFIGVVLLADARDSGVPIPTAWWVFTLGSVLAMMSPYEPVSVLRYSLAVLPLFAGFAWKMRPSWDLPTAIALAISQGVLAFVVIIGTLYPHTATLWP